MADGVFMQQQSGLSDTFGQLLQARYAAAQAQAQQVRDKQMNDQKLRAELLGRMTLAGPGGAPAGFGDYLTALNGGQLPQGMTATPTTFATGAARNQTQEDVAGKKSADEMKKQGVALRDHWAKQLKPGETQKASYFMPPETLQQYGISPDEKIGSSQRPAGAGGKGGGKSPEQTRLEALKATATSLYRQLGVASKEDANRMFSSLRSLSPEQQHIKGQLAQIDAETAKLGGVSKGAGGGDGQFDDLYKKHGLVAP